MPPEPGTESATVKWQRTLIERLYAFRNNPNQCDVTLECTGGEKVYAHEVVLKATIPFFECVFNSDFEEAKTRRVVFPYITAKTMGFILDHVYKGELKRITTATTARRIISVAHMFQLTDLHQHCLNILVTDVQPQNCFETAQIAEIYESYCLKVKVLDFLTVNHFGASMGWDYDHAKLTHLTSLMKFASRVKLVSLDKLFLEVLHFLSTKVKIEDRKLWACELMKCVDIETLSEDCIRKVKFKECMLAELGIGPTVEEFSKSKYFYNAEPSRSIANIRLILHRFSKMKIARSQLVELKHCSWGLKAEKSTVVNDTDTSIILEDWLSVFLFCNPPCYRNMKLRLVVAVCIVNHDDDRLIWSKQIDAVFSDSEEQGLPRFASWNEILNSTEGFIKDDVVILDAYLVCLADH